MKPERWEQVQGLLVHALDLDFSEQEAFIESACGQDPSLRAEVNALVESDRRAGAFLENAIGLSAATLDSSPVEAGCRIGPYQLERLIGRGGLSVVYLASRADHQYQGRAAVKLIRRDMETEATLRRFRNEIQILATLNHPNIAKLLDGGTTEDGLPYLVMEYVEGVPVTDFCDARRLTIAERLKLFRAICSAVDYAHQSLVIHRDLKPSNILVTFEGVPKLLDFGIAKLLDPDPDIFTPDPTKTEHRFMTPGYASPEQVLGRSITTSTDVYSLAVLLYEILTGHRPYRLDGCSSLEMERIICNYEPERPSVVISRVEPLMNSAGSSGGASTPESISLTRQATPDVLRQRLKGDLDNIVLMALNKEPGRRYSSVAEMSEDIRRHLARMPVSARKLTAAYRTGKFIQRNLIAVSAATAMAVLAVALVTSVMIQSARTARERDKAAQVSEFLVGLFRVSEPGEAQGNSVTARQILDVGASRIKEDLKDQPEVQATLMDTLGRVYTNLGLLSSAEPLLRDSLSFRRAHLESNSPDLAKGLTSLANLLQLQGKYDEAEQLYYEALAIRRRRLGDPHVQVAESLNNLGDVLHDKGDYQAAEPLYVQALEMRQLLLDAEHPDVADSLNNLALLFHDRAELDRAEPLYRRALEIRSKTLGESHPKTAQSLNNIGALLRAKGDLSEAEQLLRQGLEIDRRVLGNDHPDVIVEMRNLAALYVSKGEYDTAEPLLLNAISAGRDQGDPSDLATSLYELAKLYDTKGDSRKAEPLYEEALRVYRKSLPRYHQYTSYPLVALGQILITRRDLAKAEPLLREGLDIRRRSLPSNNWRTAEAASLLGECLTGLGRYDEAEELLVPAQATIESALGPDDRRSLNAVRRVCGLYDATHRKAQAIECRSRLEARGYRQ